MTTRRVRRTWHLIWNCLAAGVPAGMAFAVFEMVAAAIIDGDPLLPLRMVATLLYGLQALDPSVAPVTVVAVGTAVHLGLSALFGSIFGAMVSVPFIARSRLRVIVLGVVYGVGLWLVNFYVVAPSFGWTWFPAQANSAVQFAGHTFLFGLLVGVHMERVLAESAKLDF